MSEGNGQNGEQVAGGCGGWSAPSGLTVCHDARLEGMAIRWHGKQRYPINTPRKQLIKEIAERGDVTLPERILLGVYSGMDSPDPRRAGISERNAIMIVGQVQADDHFEAKAGQPQAGVTVNVGVAVQAVEGLRRDPKYLEYLRGRAARIADGDAGDVRDDGGGGAVEVPAPPTSDRHGGNGHAGRSNGNGHSPH